MAWVWEVAVVAFWSGPVGDTWEGSWRRGAPFEARHANPQPPPYATTKKPHRPPPKGGTGFFPRAARARLRPLKHARGGGLAVATTLRELITCAGHLCNTCWIFCTLPLLVRKLAVGKAAQRRRPRVGGRRGAGGARQVQQHGRHQLRLRRLPPPGPDESSNIKGERA